MKILMWVAVIIGVSALLLNEIYLGLGLVAVAGVAIIATATIEQRAREAEQIRDVYMRLGRLSEEEQQFETESAHTRGGTVEGSANSAEPPGQEIAKSDESHLPLP